MRLLIVCPDAPYPPRDGGALRIVNLARSLAARIELAVLTYVVSTAEAQMLDEFGRAAGLQVRSVLRPARRNSWTRAWHKFTRYHLPTLLSATPGAVRFNMRPVMQHALVDALRRFQPDVIVWEYWFMSGFAEFARQIRPSAFQVMDAIDIEWLRLQRSIAIERSWSSLERRFSLPRLRRYEAERARQVDRVTTLTEVDAQIVQRESPDIEYPWVLPMGLRPEDYSDLGAGRPNRLLFFGSFRHAPNVDAVKFLLQEIFPAIQRTRADSTLDIMGPGLPRSLERLARAQPGVRVLGFQPDIRPVLKEAAVVIAPLRFGSGVKVKLLEAMALGKTVVTTPVGAEGIGAQPGIDWIVTHDQKEMACETSRLLEDQQARTRIGQCARNRILANHDASRIAGELLERLQGAR
jgi:glycosyltransferase involved in cell wall biosynthesis